MPGYIIVDVKTRNILIPCIIVASFLFIIGIIIGYFSSPKADCEQGPTCNLRSTVRDSCPTVSGIEVGRQYLNRYIEKERTSCVQDSNLCNTYKLPRTYNAYHLNGKEIKIDGKLNDDAWQEVPWSEKFTDMRSAVYASPFLDTKIKMRWDDSRLYVGAYIQETNLWATHTRHDSSIWRENGFEMLMDVDGSMFFYKQMQINVLGTMMDQVLSKSPHDADQGYFRLEEWTAGTNSEVYYEGTVNTPGDIDKYWTAEMSFTFEALAANSARARHAPAVDEVWFINFGRSEQTLNVSADNTYVQVKGVPTYWWSWQPCGAINLHLQDRWGLVQFKNDTFVNQNNFSFKLWHIYRALFDMMDAMKKYKAINAKYTDQIQELDVPAYLLSQTCVEIPNIVLTKRNGNPDFNVTVKSKLMSNYTGHIRSDRYVTFE